MPKVLARKTVDMPVLLAAKLEAAARARGVSEAQLMREILGAFLNDIPVPRKTPEPTRLADRWNGPVPTSESIDDQYLLHTEQKYDDSDD